MNPNSITNYAGRGELPQHIALVAVLVAEMAARGLDYRSAIAKVAPTKKPRGTTRRGRFGGDRQASLDFRRSEEHPSELQSLVRISFAVVCWKKKNSAIS